MSERERPFGDLDGLLYGELRRRVRIHIPRAFNMGVVCADERDPGAPAIVVQHPRGDPVPYTFRDLVRGADRIGNVLASSGAGVGDRVAVVLPQGVESAIAQLGVLRAGGVVVPLSALFGPDALRYRLGDSGAVVLVTDLPGLERVADVVTDLPDLKVVLVTGERTDGQRPRGLGKAVRVLGFDEALQAASGSFTPVATRAEDPALLVYTSGTTGPPKGVLHAHRFLLGSLPAMELVHVGLPHPGDLLWTPADWAWVAALMDVVLPGLYYGVPVLAAPRGGRFDPEWAMRLMATRRVANAYLPPTALKLLRRAGRGAGSLVLRSVMTGGEALGDELLAWGREVLGVTIEETYGQTEANLTVGNASRFWPVRPGSMGRPYPGHRVTVRREDGSEADPGEVGELHVATPDPATFLRYWGRPEETAERYDGTTIRSGDLAHRDEDGYLWFHGRTDDLINSAGYRIGPTEIEDCLLRHPAVSMAAAIGVPDPERGEVVKAFLVLEPRREPSAELEAEIRDFARQRLGAISYPRLVEFIDELPLTTSGKIRRGALRDREAERLRGA